MKTPLSHEPAKYPSTLLSAVQCVILGFCMNWTSLLVLKAMSGRVRLKYWRLPTRARYSLGEGMRLPESLSNLYVADIGVDARPRCSAVGEAAFTQHEPFLVSPKGLVKNPFNWNREASMIYLDSPAGVGFSYSANTYDYIFLNDEFAGNVWASKAQVLEASNESSILGWGGQYSGYITVDVNHQRNLFYYFVEVEVDRSSKPVILWLHGGPRCSAVGEAAFTQHEPFLVSPKGLVKNPFNWNREASMIYLDSPAGVGFSYSANTYDYIFLNDEFAVRVEEKTDCLIVVVLVWVDCSRLQLRDSPEAKGLTL
ncbi:hypothetical protein KIW84_010555 [Lathyrus oleraceus]|uniref:Uncharacterized protein n=1 Tax=Pisum sativum TaxID=3888 RepID=A0A9D4YL74_PEA|nr:hypothetical protein KIW84_010555 [Pisum sativum]